MIPQIDNSIIPETINIINYPNFTYKITETQTVGKIDNLEAIKQAVYHILRVERYAYPIYDDDYGVELEKYIGQSIYFLESTIEDTLKEALLQDDRIDNVIVTNIEEITTDFDNTDLTISDKTGTKAVNVEFDVYCKQGIINMEVEINV